MPVAVVSPDTRGPLTGLVPQMISKLALQRRFQHPLGQLLQEAALPGELHATGLSPRNQLGDQPSSTALAPLTAAFPGPSVSLVTSVINCRFQLKSYTAVQTPLTEGRRASRKTFSTGARPSLTPPAPTALLPVHVRHMAAWRRPLVRWR